MAAAAGGAALDCFGPNPSDDAPRLESPPGKGKKPVALADISNTGRRNNTRSLSVADVVKENAMLVELLKEKTRTIEQCKAEIQKLRFTLQSMHQQNMQFAQAHSQMLAEQNQGKDRLKALQHELSCTAALLKVKSAELEAANQRWKVNSQDVRKGIPSKVAAGVSHRIDGSVNSATEHHLVESRSVMPSAAGCQEPPNDLTNKRGRNKRKSESTTGNDIDMSLQNVRRHGVMSSGFKKIEQPRKEVNLKEIQEACSSLPEIGAHQIGDTTSNTKRSLSAETQSSLPFNIAEPPEALEDTGNERGASKRKLKNGKDSAIEHVSAKCDSSTGEPLCHDERRKSQRRKSARLDSLLSVNTMSTPETLHEDVICPLTQSSTNASMEQTINQKQTECCSSMEASEGQVSGRRRSMRRAAEKVVSYKEISVNAKMRRP